MLDLDHSRAVIEAETCRRKRGDLAWCETHGTYWPPIAATCKGYPEVADVAAELLEEVERYGAPSVAALIAEVETLRAKVESVGKVADHWETLATDEDTMAQSPIIGRSYFAQRRAETYRGAARSIRRALEGGSDA